MVLTLILKQTLRRISGTIGLSPTQFPTLPYRYTHGDARRIYNLVINGTLTHESGHETTQLEKEFSEYIGTKYATAVNSGTSALQLAVKALDIKPGDEVVVPAYTFVAVAQAVLTCGGIPVFADIDDTFTISPDSIASVLSPRTRAVIAVHMFGNVADLGRILALTGNHKIAVIEDCAQAIGARYKGKRVGSIGDIGCFSFNEKKALPTGQGGMITTSNRVFLRNIVASRNTGIEITDHRTDVTTPGFTMFMTEMEASLARGILPKVDALNHKRQKNYTDLIQRLTDIGDYISWYRVVSGAEPSYSRFVCMVDFRRLTVTRDVFLRLLRTSGIPVKAFYPTPLYRYSLFQQKKSFFAEHPCAFSERFCRDQIGMEFSPYLTHGNLAYFAEALQSLIHDRRKK